MYLAAFYTLLRQTTTATRVVATALVLRVVVGVVAGADTWIYLSCAGVVAVGLAQILVRNLLLPIGDLLVPTAAFRHLADATVALVVVTLLVYAVEPNLLIWVLPLTVLTAAAWMIAATWPNHEQPVPVPG